MNSPARYSVYQLWFWLWLLLVAFLLPFSVHAQTISWLRQFGTSGSEFGYDIATTSDAVYVAGSTAGSLPGQTGLGLADAFLSRYDADGNLIWTQQFGTSSTDHIYAIAANSSGIYVAGRTGGSLPGATSAGGSDAFVRKYDSLGVVIWTRQFGTSSNDQANGIAVDGTGVYVAGHTAGAFPGQTNAGDDDVFIRKYDLNGAELWTRQFGSDLVDIGNDVAVDSAGVTVVGVAGGVMPGQSSSGDDDIFLRRYDINGTEIWTSQFGTSGSDGALGATAGSSGIYVGGWVARALSGQTASGSDDIFVRKYDSSGTVVWTRQFGTSGFDGASSLSVGTAELYVGGWVAGALPGQTAAGQDDIFVRKYDLNGTAIWETQFGSSSGDQAQAVAELGTSVFVAGVTSGSLPSQSASGGFDAFAARLSPSVTPPPPPPPPPPPNLPTVNSGGVVNSASYISASTTVAPGSIAVIFGSNLTDGNTCFQFQGCNPKLDANGKLETTMIGTQVSINGVPVPIFYASPLQLAVQIPVDTVTGTSTIQVSVNGQEGPQQTFEVEAVAPGVFTFDSSGTGPGAITNAAGVPLTTGNSVRSGEFIVIYATGLGTVTPPIDTGVLPQNTGIGPHRSAAPVTVLIDGISVEPTYAGLAGCCAGLNQINVRVPAGTRIANDIPVRLVISNKQSNITTLAVAP